MENKRNEIILKIMDILNIMPEYALHIIFGFTDEIAKSTIQGYNSQRG